MSNTNGNGNGNGGNGNGYPAETWSEIKREYFLGQLSVAAISRTYGPSRTAIMKKAERLGWHRKLSSDVRNAINRKTIEAELQETITPENYTDAIERYGEKGAGIIGAHKVIFTKILSQVDATLNDLKASQGVIEKLARSERVTKPRVMAAKLMVQESNRILSTVAQVVDKIVPLQRQAFNLDETGKGAENITYVIVGDLEKPVTAGMAKIQMP
jgi:transposase-like protein